MSTIDQARATLDLTQLKLPEKPRIDELCVEEYVDASGNDALRILLILNENVTDKELTGEVIWRIKLGIRDALLAQGIHEFPYIFFAKRSELDQLQAEE